MAYRRVLPVAHSERVIRDASGNLYRSRRDTYGPSRQGYPPDRIVAIVDDLLAHDRRSTKVQVILGTWEKNERGTLVFTPLASTLLTDGNSPRLLRRDIDDKVRRYIMQLGMAPEQRGKRGRPKMGIQVVRETRLKRGEVTVPRKRDAKGRFV